jgi:hypothetical protein
LTKTDDDLPLALRCLASELCVEETAPWHRLREAADEIERLTRERDGLRAALRGTVDVIETTDWTAFSLADRARLDAARDLLSERQVEPEKAS